LYLALYERLLNYLRFHNFPNIFNHGGTSGFGLLIIAIHFEHCWLWLPLFF